MLDKKSATHVTIETPWKCKMLKQILSLYVVNLKKIKHKVVPEIVSYPLTLTIALASKKWVPNGYHSLRDMQPRFSSSLWWTLPRFRQSSMLRTAPPVLRIVSHYLQSNPRLKKTQKISWSHGTIPFIANGKVWPATPPTKESWPWISPMEAYSVPYLLPSQI